MWTQFVLRLSDVHIWDTWTINTDEQWTHPCVCNYTSGYKSMRQVLQCIPLKTMAALAVLEDIVNGAIGRELVLRDREHLLAHDDNWLISRFEGNPPGTVRREVQRTIHTFSNRIVGNKLQAGTVRDGGLLGEKLYSCICPNIIPRDVHWAYAFMH